jgi:putative spermidine/putrescine transport system permease protein
MVAPASAVVALLFGGALAGGIRASLQAVPGGGTSLEAWRSLLGDPGFADALGFSLWITAAATAISAVLAVALAAGLRGRGAVLRGLAALPVPVPHLVVAVTAVLWLGPGGLVDRAAGALPVQLVRDPAGLGVIVVYVYKEVPFLALLVLAAWGPGVAEREEAAATLGAGPWQRLRLIVWPAIRAPLVTGSLVVAAFVLGAFEVPLVLGPTYPPTLAVYALEATRTADLDGHARAAASLLVAAGASLLLALAAAGRARDRDA